MGRHGRACSAALVAALVLHATRGLAQEPKPASGSPEGKGAAQPGPSTSAPPREAAPPPAGSAAPPEGPPSGPPPQYYVEPQQAPREGPPPAYEPAYEPPPPPLYYEPEPPPEPLYKVPKSAFWAGARLSWVSPGGSLWTDGFSTPNGIYYRRRSFADYASSGPALEIDFGARLARRYNVFVLWEHATLGRGSLDPDAFGGQQRGAMNLYGIGVRYSTEPSSVGLAIEIALGYRDFRAYWNDGTALSMTDGWLDARIGIGADIRLGRAFSLSPMFTIAGGSFDHGHWSGPNRSLGFDAIDNTAGYSVIGFQLGGHVDIY